MSKTIELQIGKSRTLIDGLRKNLQEIARLGISESDLDGMDEKLRQLSAANAECDALRADLSQKVKQMNAILGGVKEAFAEKKKAVKVNYPQEEWARYGVTDKR